MTLPRLPKIIGITKIRNESLIIKETLDRWAGICTGGIYVYDDVSTDSTVQICKEHPAVKFVIEGTFWDPDREKAEWMNRQMVLDRARKDVVGEADVWFVYFDADEHLYNFDQFELFLTPGINAIACRLYDLYITPEDVTSNYLDREMIGPEFRTIVFFFRNMPGIQYYLPDQRIVTLPSNVGNIPIHGDIKHYGKGLSVEHWEATCDYYIRFWPKYSDKWRKRKGKAIHDGYSDFGNPLIKWQDRMQGFSLENQTYGKN